MVQNKTVGAGLALVVALVGMGVSTTASALPEVVIGSHLVQDGSAVDVQAQSVDATVTEEGDSAAADDDAESSAD